MLQANEIETLQCLLPKHAKISLEFCGQCLKKINTDATKNPTAPQVYVQKKDRPISISDIESSVSKKFIFMTPEGIVSLQPSDDLLSEWKHKAVFRKELRRTWSKLCSDISVFDQNFVDKMAETGIKVLAISWIGIRQGQNLIL